MKESGFKLKHMIEQLDKIAELTDISHDKLPTIPEKSAFIFHHTSYPKSEIGLENATISQET